MANTALFLFAWIVLLVLTVQSARKLVRAQTLKLTAALMRRRLPLESALKELSLAQTGHAAEALAGRVSLHLESGNPLSQALRFARVLDPQQAIALDIAQKHGAGEMLLDLLAERATRMHRRLLQTAALSVYPLVIGFILAGNAVFISTVIIPKFKDMFSEMGIASCFVDATQYVFPCAATLFGWGLLSFSLHVNSLGRRLWRDVPVLGLHFRLAEQGAFARNLSFMLRAGATLEAALTEVVRATAGGPLQEWLECSLEALQSGERPADAFRANGQWRPEILWALESISGGAPPGPCLEAVADVLEDKAALRLNVLHRVMTPLAILIAACGVGALGYTFFHTFTAIQRGIIP